MFVYDVKLDILLWTSTETDFWSQPLVLHWRTAHFGPGCSPLTVILTVMELNATFHHQHSNIPNKTPHVGPFFPLLLEGVSAAEPAAGRASGRLWLLNLQQLVLKCRQLFLRASSGLISASAICAAAAGVIMFYAGRKFPFVGPSPVWEWRYAGNSVLHGTWKYSCLFISSSGFLLWMSEGGTVVSCSCVILVIQTLHKHAGGNFHTLTLSVCSFTAWVWSLSSAVHWDDSASIYSAQDNRTEIDRTKVFRWNTPVH